MNKFHIAIAVSDIEQSVEDYSERLQCQPSVVVPGEYALWRTEGVNFSIRRDTSVAPGSMRHLGWEDDSATEFSASTDVNGIVWERFPKVLQEEEITRAWPHAKLPA